MASCIITLRHLDGPNRREALSGKRGKPQTAVAGNIIMSLVALVVDGVSGGIVFFFGPTYIPSGKHTKNPLVN